MPICLFVNKQLLKQPRRSGFFSGQERQKIQTAKKKKGRRAKGRLGTGREYSNATLANNPMSAGSTSHLKGTVDLSQSNQKWCHCDICLSGAVACGVQFANI